MKTCSKCKVEKPLDQFLKVSGYRHGIRSYCNGCASLASRIWASKNRDKANARTRAWREKNRAWDAAYEKSRRARMTKDELRTFDQKRNLARYGVTIEQYDSMYRAQNGVCAVCSKVNLSGRRLAVDHDHDTGRVRGLLCSRCNSAIGLARESLDVLKKAVLYLERHQTLSQLGIGGL